MIVPMTKYHFVIYHRELENFVLQLRELGVFHIKEKHKLSESTRELIKDLQQLEFIIDFYNLEPSSEPSSKAELPAMVSRDWKQNIEHLDQLQKELRVLQQELHLLQNSIGSFSTQKLKALHEKGLYAYLYSCKPGKFNSEWTDQHGAVLLNESGRKWYFVLFSIQETPPSIEAQLEQLPERGTQELELAIEEKNKAITDLEKELEFRIENRGESLLYTYNSIKDQIQLNKNAHQVENFGEGRLQLMEGWIPSEKEDDVEQALNEAGVYFEKTDPNPDEKNPILLKNNAYGKLFEPIGSLFSLPSYSELDLTPLFAPFFTLFFGFCLGDAGYGLIILVGITLFGHKLGEQNRGIVRLAQILGLATVLFGTLTGTLFGVDLGAENSTLLPQNIRELFLGADELFYLSLAIGWVQILFGMGVKMVNQYKQFGWLYTLSTFGWIILTIGLTLLGLGSYKIIEPVVFDAWICYAGIALILAFNDPKANVFVRLGKGIWELYGISGLFGDLLSYIRLFALGLSSSILGLVVNDIGLGFIDINPIAGPILFVLFMVIGHGLNLFIAGLGAFVHPMRLTFVEFYKNAGFAGGGMKYEPFKKEIT
jgi:V/A-type H+-transporting ATPase subunit I